MTDEKKDAIEPGTRFEDVEKMVKLNKDKQESLDKAVPKIKNFSAEVHSLGGPEKYKNEDLTLRLVAFAITLQSGKHGVLGKSPAFILERFAAVINSTAPHVTLDAQLKRNLDQYKTDWLRARQRV